MEEGEKWHEIRSKVQQDLMRPKSAHFYINEISNVADEFMEFIRNSRNPENQVNEDFLPEIYRFTFESICYIALDTRLGCFKKPMDPEIAEVFSSTRKFLGNNIDNNHDGNTSLADKKIFEGGFYKIF